MEKRKESSNLTTDEARHAQKAYGNAVRGAKGARDRRQGNRGGGEKPLRGGGAKRVATAQQPRVLQSKREKAKRHEFRRDVREQRKLRKPSVGGA